MLCAGTVFLGCSWSSSHLYKTCCRPEIVKEPRNRSRNFGHNGIAVRRRPKGDPKCWGAGHCGNSFENCCRFSYRGLSRVYKSEGVLLRSSVHFLPWKSVSEFEYDLSTIGQWIVLKQSPFLGSQYDMGGYPGVAWPDGVVLANKLQDLWRQRHLLRDELRWQGRALELAAGKFALPSIVLASTKKFSANWATDQQYIVDPTISKYGITIEPLDMCNKSHVLKAGVFDVIVSAGGATQSNCGPKALIDLSAPGSLVILVARTNQADSEMRNFLLSGYFQELYSEDLVATRATQPGEDVVFVVWRRVFGPHSCWARGDLVFTYRFCCSGSPDSVFCFDEVWTRAICCGTKVLMVLDY